MDKRIKGYAAAVSVAVMGLSSSVLAQSAPDRELAYPIAVISGMDFADRTSEGHSGVYYALNGDLARSGAIFRIFGTMGSYDYDGVFGKIDSDYWIGDAMIGYQIVQGRWDLGILVGVEHQDHELTPDDLTNRLRGSETGFKVVADLETNASNDTPLYFALRGSYSTAFESYYGLGRIGFRTPSFVVGPEAWAFGDVEGNSQRLGGFLKFDLPMLGTTTTEVTLSAGYQWNDNSSGRYSGVDDGLYTTLKFITSFGTTPSRQYEPLK